MKEMWVGYNVVCTMGLFLGHSAWQKDRPSNGSMWNSSLNALFYFVTIIMKFSGVITIDRSDVHATGQGQGSMVKVTEVKKNLSYFERLGTITPVVSNSWLWNDTQSLKWSRRGALLFLKVICKISWSHRTKNRQFWPELVVSRL